MIKFYDIYSKDKFTYDLKIVEMTNEMYREQIKKHVRNEDFTDTQRLPLTMNQEHGE